MKYKFTKNSYSADSIEPLYEFGVEVSDDSIAALERIEWWGWTVEEAQKIIDKAKSLKGEEFFDYIVEGSELRICIDTEGVLFFDWRTSQPDGDFSWTFDEFIEFMEQFKEFIAENS